jgi:tRNA threonylcarbamoyladenosine biosynthesis protein TsaE
VSGGAVEELFSALEAATLRAGAALARRLSGGDVVLLFGELGTGKTVFVRGLAEGLGADPDEVSSPTFALVHEYGPAGHAPVLVHADFYRLPDEELAARGADLGLEEHGNAVLAIEWPRPPWTAARAWRVTISEAPGGRKIRTEPPREE